MFKRFNFHSCLNKLVAICFVYFITNIGFICIGNHMNTFLNRYERALLDEMQLSFENALSYAFISIIQPFFNRVPLNTIFID